MNEVKETNGDRTAAAQDPGETSRLSRRKFLALAGSSGIAATLATTTVTSIADTGREREREQDNGPLHNIIFASATDLAAAIRRKKVSSEEVVKAYLVRIAQINPKLNAVVQLTADSALAQARAADAALAQGQVKGPLHGVPVTIKDLFEVAGVISSSGTYGRRAFIPAKDATAVARLKAAGAIVLGLTNVPELGQAFVSSNIVYGRTNNPYDLSRTPGGSSGGEGAIIAAGGSPFGIGSDAGGSIRVPSHFCGIAGIKPTSGRASRTGHFPGPGGPVDKIWQIGPMSRFVEDLFLGLQIISGSDAGDSNIYPVPLLDPRRVRLQNLRVGFFTDNGLGGFATPTPETVNTVRAAVRALQDARVTVEEVTPPIKEPVLQVDILTLFLEVFEGDGGASLAAFLDSIGTPADKQSPEIQKGLQLFAPLALPTSVYQTVLYLWDFYRSAMLSFIEPYDVLVCPTCAIPAFPHPDLSTATLLQDAAFSYTFMFNLTGWPAAVVRCGTSPEGLPIGVQVVAKPWREDVALAVAQHLEEALGGWKRPPI